MLRQSIVDGDDAGGPNVIDFGVFASLNRLSATSNIGNYQQPVGGQGPIKARLKHFLHEMVEGFQIPIEMISC